MYRVWDLLEIYETDGNLSMENKKFRAQCYNKDVIETKLAQLVKNHQDRSFLIFNHTTARIIAVSLDPVAAQVYNHRRG